MIKGNNDDERLLQAKISQLETKVSNQKFTDLIGSLSNALSSQSDEKSLKGQLKSAKEAFDELNSKYNFSEMIETVEERNNLRLELSKMNNIKGTLEKLCRELQKENKMIKEQSLTVLAEEQEKRSNLSLQFEKSVQDIQVKLEQDAEVKAKYENLQLKFQTFLEQYEVREKHYESILKTKELEAQLADAKLQQSLEINSMQREKIEKLELQISQLLDLELKMKEQIVHYGEKYKIFENSLKDRDSYLKNFEADRERMRKVIARLENDLSNRKSKSDALTKSLQEMAEEKGKDSKIIDGQKKQILKLESLCRALQERSSSSNTTS